MAAPPSESEYLTGWGGHLESEALPGALPRAQNNPQVCPYGLVAEQLSGTAFTVPRSKNLRSWLYRIRPSVGHSPYTLAEPEGRLLADFSSAAAANCTAEPNQLRWGPIPLPPPDKPTDFIRGLETVAGAGDAARKDGVAIHVYAVNSSMNSRAAFSNADGDMLIVPQLGTLVVKTEFGSLTVPPRSVVVVPRGIKFNVALAAGGAGEGEGGAEGAGARGYVLEIFKGHFTLPDLGPIGSNGLANPRDIKFPKAAYDADTEDATAEPWVLTHKYMGQLFQATAAHSPFNVVAWHGNYVPFLYCLEDFCCMNSVTYDHPDPSIYTVFTAPSDELGTAVADFVIFPPRWMVQENTFRPPWYHVNVMSEYMGMIWGSYDAKVGFQPGGSSLHPCLTAHGPDAATFAAASAAALAPTHFNSGLAFMFETGAMLRVSRRALAARNLDVDYHKCWDGIPVLFDAARRDVEVEVEVLAAIAKRG